MVPKQPPIENVAYSQMMSLLPRYSLAPSKWNRSRGAAKMIFRFKVKTESGEVRAGAMSRTRTHCLSGRAPCQRIVASSALIPHA
eukprot:3338146-Prymnesium_polylepis.1